MLRTQLWLKLVSKKMTRLPPMNIIPEKKIFIKVANACKSMAIKVKRYFKECRKSTEDDIIRSENSVEMVINLLKIGILNSAYDIDGVLHINLNKVKKKRKFHC